MKKAILSIIAGAALSAFSAGAFAQTAAAFVPPPAPACPPGAATPANHPCVVLPAVIKSCTGAGKTKADFDACMSKALPAANAEANAKFAADMKAAAPKFVAPPPPVCAPNTPANNPCVVQGSAMKTCASSSTNPAEFSACMNKTMPAAMAEANAKFMAEAKAAADKAAADKAAAAKAAADKAAADKPAADKAAADAKAAADKVIADAKAKAAAQAPAFVAPVPPACPAGVPANHPCVIQAPVMKDCGASSKNMADFSACMNKHMPAAIAAANAPVFAAPPPPKCAAAGTPGAEICDVQLRAYPDCAKTSKNPAEFGACMANAGATKQMNCALAPADKKIACEAANKTRKP